MMVRPFNIINFMWSLLQLLGGEELMITKIGQDRYYKKLFFFQQITAFYEDNFPEVMKNILVVKGEIMHSSSFIRNY